MTAEHAAPGAGPSAQTGAATRGNSSAQTGAATRVGSAARGGSVSILIVSTRAAAGSYEDVTGPLIERWATNRGWTVAERRVEPDGPGVGPAITALLEAAPDLIVTSGGTGIHPHDRTPDQTRPLLDFEIPGFAEELRRRGGLKVASALLSRGLAGVAGATVVVNLPGSSGGVKDGLGLLDDVLDHMIDQLHGGDHRRAD